MAAKDFNNQIATCAPYNGGVHIHTGLNIIADVLGLEIKEGERDDPDYPIIYVVFYNGVRFYQIEEERLDGYGND